MISVIEEKCDSCNVLDGSELLNRRVCDCTQCNGQCKIRYENHVLCKKCHGDKCIQQKIICDTCLGAGVTSYDGKMSARFGLSNEKTCDKCCGNKYFLTNKFLKCDNCDGIGHYRIQSKL